MKAFLTLMAPVFAELWTVVIYPAVQKFEPIVIGKLPSEVQPIATAIANDLNTFVGAEIAKL